MAPGGLPHHLRSDENLRQHWVVDSSKIRSELGFIEPIPLGEGIVRSVRWQRANPPDQVAKQRFDYAIEDAVLAGVKRLTVGNGG